MHVCVQPTHRPTSNEMSLKTQKDSSWESGGEKSVDEIFITHCTFLQAQ